MCINSGGEKIFPEEVESVLKAHPDVFDVLVVGVPDERWGSAVAAVVQPTPAPAPTLDELDAHARPKLAGYKLPRHLVSSTRSSAPPPASPTTPGPPESPPNRRQHRRIGADDLPPVRVASATSP